MTADSGTEKMYINCSRCKLKYLNNEDSIKENFGYNRLNEMYKTCVNCRKYKQDNREKILEQKREYAKIHYQNNKEELLEKGKRYREENKDKNYAKDKEK